MKRREFLKSVTALAAGSAPPAAPAIWSPAKAQSRQETLLIVSESGPNNIDIHGVGTNVPGYEVSWNCYDRLISHEIKTLPNGTQYYERDKFKLELADDMSIGDMSVTFKLKKNAVFQDGTPVGAKDVKWSLDRAVSVGGFPTFQMGAGSLTKPEQFVVVDDNTIRVDFLRKDLVELKDSGKLTIVSTPYSNGIQYIGMNVKTPPFDNLKVRQAVAYAIPYQKIMDAVLFGLAAPMFGAAADAPTVAAWPQPHKYNTDIAKAKALLAEAGYANGFETTLSFDLGFAGVNEPLCVLTQESLAQIGIKCRSIRFPARLGAPSSTRR